MKVKFLNSTIMRNLKILNNFRDECCSKQSSPASQNEEPMYNDDIDIEESSAPLQSSFKAHKHSNETNFEW